MRLQPGLKRGLGWSGSALALTGVAFVAMRLSDYAGQINFNRFDSITWSIVGCLAVVYGVSNLMLALAWWNLLSHFGTKTAKRWALKIYGISQLAKYLPGNIFHLAGRQAMGMAADVAGWPLAKSSVWELGLIAVAGSLFAVLALPLFIAKFPVVLGLTLFLAALGCAAILLWYVFGPLVMRALGWYTVFLAISGCLFVVLLELVGWSDRRQEISLLPVVGAYVLAWLAGLVTPGAPAGMGVRELVLISLLNGAVNEANLLLAVLLGRLVTVMGDVLYFLMAYLAESYKTNSPVNE